MKVPSFVAGCTPDGVWRHLSEPLSIGRARAAYDAILAAGGIVDGVAHVDIAIFESPAVSATRQFSVNISKTLVNGNVSADAKLPAPAAKPAARKKTPPAPTAPGLPAADPDDTGI